MFRQHVSAVGVGIGGRHFDQRLVFPKETHQPALGLLHHHHRARFHVAALGKIAQARGQSLAQLALSWALRDRRVTSVLIGASSVAQLDDSLAARESPPFTAEELDQIDKHAVDAGINLWAGSSDS